MLTCSLYKNNLQYFILYMMRTNNCDVKMKKIILMLIVLAFTLSLFALQTVRVTVILSAEANGTVLVADEFFNVIASNYAAQFNEGSTDFDFEIAGSYNTATLYAYAEGTTPCGAFDETEYVQGFSGTPPTCYLALNFIIDIAVLVYSNIEIDGATIQLWDDGSLYGVESEDLIKGWTKVYFDEISLSSFDVTTCYAEATAEGVGNETYTLITTNPFVYNPETERFENDDIEFCFENKPLHSDWNWESLPKLEINSTTNNGETNMVTLLVDNIVPGGYNWLNVLVEEFDLEYNPENTPPWNPDPYWIRSSDGFKIKLDNPQENRIYCANGMRVLENTTIVLHAGWNYIGYWLPYSQMSDVAFGENWSNVNQMKSEDWYYDDCRMERGFPGAGEPITWSPKPLHYGEGYMVDLYEPINNFYWETSEGRSKNFNKPESDYFSYEKKADYEVIDVVNVDTSISEIGVFADGVCVGAVVVQDSSEQILVYSNNFNRDPLPFDFEVITGRGLSIPIKNYEVFNRFTGEFEQGIIISGMQEYSIIMLGVEGEQEDNTPSITKLHSNYPNPFNPSTTISFSVPQTSPFVTLKIFNIKGQKVKTLYKGKAEEGKHTITWNGEDENNKPVSSGIYFYKLKAGEKEISRKMLLLK